MYTWIGKIIFVICLAMLKCNSVASSLHNPHHHPQHRLFLILGHLLSKCILWKSGRLHISYNCGFEKSIEGGNRKTALVWLHPITVWAINGKSQRLFYLPLKSMEEWNYYKSIQSWEVKYLLTLKERLSWLQGFQ